MHLLREIAQGNKAKSDFQIKYVAYLQDLQNA